MKKFFASVRAVWLALSSWGSGNAASIYTGCIVVIFMMGIMVVQDMRYASREVGHLRGRAELISITEKIQLARAEEHKLIDFQSEIIYDLRQGNEKKDLYIMRANDVINDLSGRLSYAQAVIETLKEYLKSLGEWPPKVPPPSAPRPINPDSLAGRSEA